MKIIEFLAPIVEKACYLEDLDPQSVGEFIRTLSRCSDLDEDKKQLLLEHVITPLVETNLLESCEFHEGLGDFLPAGRMVELLVGGYPSESSDRLGEVVATLFGLKALKIDKDGWTLIRAHMSAPDFRAMLTQLFEMSCDGMHQMASLLSDMFNVDDEFEIAETIRLVLESHWILDILPSKRKAAQRILRGAIVERFPYTEKVVDDFCQEILRLEPPIDKVASGASVSSDSDIESKGSLNEFVVDSDEEDGDETGSEDESEYSSSADDESPVRRKSHKRSASVSSSSSREVVPKKKARREVKSLSSDSASFDSDYR